MPITLTRLGESELAPLSQFLCSNHWPFHGQAVLEPATVERGFGRGQYHGDDVQTFWLTRRNGQHIGLIRVFDLCDDTPVFDLRLAESQRGNGYGGQALQLLAEYVFCQLGKRRLEGYTRHDNQAMLTTFTRCGFVKEAHHRQAWPDGNGTYYDAVGFTLLKSDWQSGSSTPIAW